MSWCRFAFIGAFAMVTLSLMPLVSAQMPDYTEEDFAWLIEDADDDAASSGGAADENFAQFACGMMGGGPTGDASDSPCEALSYAIGHTDSHFLFRWTMATLEFDETMDFSLVFDTGFRGNHPGEDYNRNFKFLLGVNANDAWVEVSQGQIGPDEFEDWSADTILDLDRGAGTLTIAVPLELIETRVDPERGALVGESFNVTREPVVEVVNEECEDGGMLPECTSFMKTFKADGIGGATSEANRVYRIHPTGELAPRLVEETISGAQPTIELVLKRPTWETYHYQWDASAFGGFKIDQAVNTTGGTVAISMVGPEEEEGAYYEDLEASEEASAEVGDLEPGQQWTLRVELTDWVEGNVTIGLEGLEFVPEGSSNGGGGSGGGGGANGGGGGGNGTKGPDGGDLEEGEAPAPGVALLLVALIGLVALYRRR